MSGPSLVDRFELATALRTAGVPAAAVQRPSERIDDDPGTTDWGLWPTVTHSKMGDVRVDGIPVHFSKTDWVITRGAPCLGEHNDVVFRRPPRLHRGRSPDLSRRKGCCERARRSPTAVPGALDGVRVVELASEHGAFAGKILADLGAEVIVVEPPGGHASRRSSPSSTTCPGRNGACGGGTTTRAS